MNYLAKNYKIASKIRKITFLILTIISITLIFQIGLKWIPFFDSNLRIETANNINNTVLSLALSYIAGFIFYLFVSYFPEKTKQKSVFLIINPRIDTIVNGSFLLIAYVKKRLDINSSYLELQKNNFNKLNCFFNNKSRFSYYYKDNLKDRQSLGDYSEYKYFEFVKEFTIKTIDDFFKIPSFIFLPDDLIEILSNLRDCKLFQHSEMKGLPIPVENLSSQFYEYYKLLLELKRYTLNYYDITDFELK